METPTIDHLKTVTDKTQAIHEFLEWCDYEKKVYLAGYNNIDNGDDSLYALFQYQRDNLMAEFYGIDMKAVEAEKQAILREIREKNAISTNE